MFDKISGSILERGFDQSKLLIYFLMKKNMICDSYADDTFLDDLDAKSLKESIKRTGIIEDEQRHTFELRYEGAVDDF